MRSWVGAVVCVVAAIGVAGQGGVDPNIRLGLLATDLGIDPVPGANPNAFPGSGRQDLKCECLPVNQVCPFDAQGRTVDAIGTRITNTRPLVDGQCPVGFNRCCGLQSGGGPPTSGGISGLCGGREQLQNYQPVVPPQADFGEYPWMAVVLGPDNGYVGGGVLIRKQWVLTAAHKITSRNLKVRLGDYDLAEATDHPNFPHLEVGVRRVIIHPNFNSKSLVNDVALLELQSPIPVEQYPHIGLACLPNLNQKFEGQRECYVSGWGKDAFETGSFQTILKEVDVPIVERFSCQHSLRNTRLGEHFELDGKSFVCAGGVAGKDACTGDGGAPLVCPTNKGFTVVGLVAWGIGCAQGDVPGVYVNVASFVDFIEQNVGPLF